MENNELQKRMDNYERIIKEILGAFKMLEFHIVVESTIRKKIIPINKEDEKDKQLISDIYIIAHDFATKYNQVPITFDLYKTLVNPPKPKSFRSNEVGNFADKLIPSFFDKNKHKLKIITSFERLSLNGYPDEVITDIYNRVTYLEIKTTTRHDVGSARDFFFSPMKNSKKKITSDARHLLLCFDTFEKKKEKEFIVTGWRLIDLINIKVSMKPEFITDNLELYKKENILVEVNFEKEEK